MKSLIFVFLAFVAFAASKPSHEDAHGRFEKLSDECTKEGGVSDDVLVDALKKSELSEDKELRQHITCLAKKLDLIEDDDKFDNEKLGEIVDALKTDITDLDDGVDDCKSIEEDTPVETAFKAFTCIYHAIEAE